MALIVCFQTSYIDILTLPSELRSFHCFLAVDCKAYLHLNHSACGQFLCSEHKCMELPYSQ